MARVILNPELKGISGKIGNLVFRTYKNGHVHVFRANEEKQRKSRVSESEMANRRRFGIVSRMTYQLQSCYVRADDAAANRKKIRERVQYLYDKLLAVFPELTDQEMERAIRQHFFPRTPRD